MNSSIRRRYYLCFAVFLLSIGTTAWAVSKIPAEPRAPDAAGLLREAQRLSDGQSLADATVVARAALEAGRKSRTLSFTDLDAGKLLVKLLFQQERYDEARSAAEEQIAYWEQETAVAGSTSRRDSRIIGNLSQAIDASMMAGERVAVARLQEQLFAVVSPDRGLWRLSSDEPRLRFELANFSMPLVIGQWNLVEFEPKNTRESLSRVFYKQRGRGHRLSAEILLSYDEQQRKQTASQRQDWLNSFQGLSKAKELSSAMPDLPFDGLAAVKLGRQKDCDGEQCVSVRWTVLRGDWRMDIEVVFSKQDEAHAAQQVQQLFAALTWQSAPLLFRERTMTEQRRDIDSYWERPDGWSKAAELAVQALPDAFFQDEVAQLQTLIGVSQYRRGDLDAARRSLSLALSAWTDFTYQNLYSTALDYAADIAYRQGRRDDATVLNQRSIEWHQSDATLGWSISKDKNAFVNHWKGMSLPLRVGDYSLKVGEEFRFYYENLQTGTQIGLTVSLPWSSDSQFESILRSFMEKKLRLQAGDIQKSKFSPRTAERGEQQVNGRKWEFEVTKLSNTQGTSGEASVTGVLRKTPIKMVFWIVDHEGKRSILRAPIMDSDPSGAEANQIARALLW